MHNVYVIPIVVDPPNFLNVCGRQELKLHFLATKLLIPKHGISPPDPLINTRLLSIPLPANPHRKYPTMSPLLSLPTNEEFTRSILYFPKREALSFLNLSNQLTDLQDKIAAFPEEVREAECDPLAKSLMEDFSMVLDVMFCLLMDAHELSAVYRPKTPLLEAYVQNSSYDAFCKDHKLASELWFEVQNGRKHRRNDEEMEVLEFASDKCMMMIRFWLESDKVQWRGWDDTMGKLMKMTEWKRPRGFLSESTSSQLNG